MPDRPPGPPSGFLLQLPCSGGEAALVQRPAEATEAPARLMMPGLSSPVSWRHKGTLAQEGWPGI